MELEMTRLYFKTISIVITLIFLIVFLYQVGFSYFTQKNFDSINQIITQGTFSYIQEKLKNTPKSQWDSILKKLQPSDTPAAKIIPIESLILNKKDKTQLLNGKIVYTYGEKFHFIYFLYYGIFESFALQRIDNTQLALKMQLTQPINQTIKSILIWKTRIISNELKETSEKKWPTVLAKLQEIFNIPLKLIPTNSKSITQKMQEDLKIYKITYSEPKADKPISTLYIHTPNPQKLLAIGPIQYSPLSSLFSVAQKYYFISFAVSSLVIVILLTWLFSRNVLKIDHLTKKYSQGDFDTDKKVGRTSILHGIYQNIIAMGDNLNRLIKSQQNMTRFVAHEIRTPLSTMQLALDSIKKEANLSHQLQGNLSSIQEDIQEINQLVHYFLLYQKSLTKKLTLKKEKVDLFDWLNSIVKRYPESKIKLLFIPLKKESVFIQIDPNLLKNAVNNLITNALKYAKSIVIITLETSKHRVTIHVDDDGSGIPQSEFKNIFEPFSTLNNTQEFGKQIGLGLSIAKSIVELHKGSISVSKTPKLAGARFSITLSR